MKQNNKDKQFVSEKILTILFVVSIFVPLLLTLRSLLFGYFPFWNDPARDLLLAAANLKKLTLIGPPSGIPGIFYGPYWIWLLSMGELVGKDPRIVTFVAQAIPYYVLLPILLYIVGKKMFGLFNTTIIWLLFIFAFIGYANQLWNPDLAALIFFAMVAVVMSMGFDGLSKRLIVFSVILGMLQGLLINFHISFGTAISVSVILYFAFRMIQGIFVSKDKPRHFFAVMVSAIFFGSGFMFIMTPFLLFELRHGFSQIKTLITTLNQSYVHGSAVVGQVGMSKMQIITALLERPAMLLQIPLYLSGVVSILMAVLIVGIALKKRKNINQYQKRFLLFFCTSIAGLLLVYLTTRNPVWPYHFIATEVLFVYAIWVILDHTPHLSKILSIWVIFIIVTGYISSLKPASKSADITDLSRLENNVRSVFKDAQQKPFAYVAKNPAIYTYDYDYLFYWLGSDAYHFIPQNTVTDSSKIVYVIVPKAELSDKKGFVENRTPEKRFETTNQWYGMDGTLIIRRQLR